MADYDLDSALKSAKTGAASYDRAMTVWRLMDVEQGYAVSTKAPDRPCRAACIVNPDGTEFWA